MYDEVTTVIGKDAQAALEAREKGFQIPRKGDLVVVTGLKDDPRSCPLGDFIGFEGSTAKVTLIAYTDTKGVTHRYKEFTVPKESVALVSRNDLGWDDI